jgi:hypothetical protein
MNHGASFARRLRGAGRHPFDGRASRAVAGYSTNVAAAHPVSVGSVEEFDELIRDVPVAARRRGA